MTVRSQGSCGSLILIMYMYHVYTYAYQECMTPCLVMHSCIHYTFIDTRTLNSGISHMHIHVHCTLKNTVMVGTSKAGVCTCVGVLVCLLVCPFASLFVLFRHFSHIL